MTQPPDERDPLADKPPEQPDAPEDQPTIAWSPGGSSGEPPVEPPAPAALPPSDAPAPSGAEPPPPDSSAPPPASPIISASPAAAPPDPTGWQQPGPAAPVVAWEAAPAVAVAGKEGYVIAGMGARLVAFLLDYVIVGIIPTILTIVVLDYSSIFQQAIDTAQTSPGSTANFVMEVTPQYVLVTLITLAIEFMYFVGFWTSGGKATPGMRGLKMQVVDIATGGTLSLMPATIRFVALGFPIAVLGLVPALQSLAGIGLFAIWLFMFFTAVMNDRRQGLHDKWANSLVIRSTSSGDGATLVGCLVLIVLVVGLLIVAIAVLFAAVAPQMQELIDAIESARPSP